MQEMHIANSGKPVGLRIRGEQSSVGWAKVRAQQNEQKVIFSKEQAIQ